MRALSAFYGALALETAVDASAKARARQVELPLSPIKPGAFARWMAQREPDGIRIRDERRSALRTGIERRRA
jgi:hypothetical protein